MENPIKMDDLGVPLFLETPICLEPLSSALFILLLCFLIFPPSLHLVLIIIVSARKGGGRENVHFLRYNKPKLTSKRIHPGRLTWTTIMEVWKIIFLSKWVICRFHVNLPGCIKNYLGLQVRPLSSCCFFKTFPLSSLYHQLCILPPILISDFDQNRVGLHSVVRAQEFLQWLQMAFTSTTCNPLTCVEKHSWALTILVGKW